MKHTCFLMLLAAAMLPGCARDKSYVDGGSIAADLQDIAVVGDLSVEMRLVKRSYLPGQNLTVQLTARNTGSEPMTIEAPSGAKVFVQIERYINAHWARVNRYPEAAVMALHTWTLPPNSQKQWTVPLTVEPDWPVAEPLKVKAWINGLPNIAPSVQIRVLPAVE
jgi:hypothetical protein